MEPVFFFCSLEILIYDYKLENNKNTNVVSFIVLDVKTNCYFSYTTCEGRVGNPSNSN